MTVWEKLENEECYAVAIYNFAGRTGAPHLALEVGELVHIERQTARWYWGRSLRRDCVGAFPKSYVCTRDCVVERCGETVIASSGGGGVVHEIAVTLREWLRQWKRLYVENDGQLRFVEVSMLTLLKLRAEVATGALPQDQLRRRARTALFTIDKGNRALGMELTVRSPEGLSVDPRLISAYKLNAMHEEANSRIDKNQESIPPTAPTATVRSHTVVARVHNFVTRFPVEAELALSLHDSAGNKLTEHLLLRWPPPHVFTSSACVAFTDFGSDLLKSDKIFLVCHVIRLGSMEPPNNNDKRLSVNVASTSSTSTGGMRRPYGIACADIKKLLPNDEPDKHFMLPFYPLEKENLDSLLKKVILLTPKDLKDAKHSQGVWVSLQLVDGDLKQIREENAHVVVGNVHVARKMGFPEVIMPGDARNELYVTICSGSFSKGGGKSSERNIEMVARVCDSNGKIIPGVISIGAGVPMASEFTSVVYYHDDKPRWQEIFKVCLDIESFKEAHLVFLCRHRSSNEAKDRAEKHFALSYLRLMQREGTTIPDKEHKLCVYKIDSKRASSDIETEIASACLALPSRRSELPAGYERAHSKGTLGLIPKDSLVLATKLCSTKLTAREEILGVLKWKTAWSEGTLKRDLTRLLKVPSDELVKFLQDILDALFNILSKVDEQCEEYTEDSYSVLVVECLLAVISLVADHKYHHFQPVLALYVEESFCDALAYVNLISVLVWVIRQADSSKAALKRLLVCMKCIESLIRVIVRSRQLRRTLGDSDAGFNDMFERLLDALVWLMRCGDHALTCQGSALKYLPYAVPHIIKVYPDTMLCTYIVRALEALPFNRLSKQRMLALLELVKGPLCVNPGARAIFLPHLASTLKTLLKDKAEWDREAALKSRSVGKAARLLGADTTRLHDRSQQGKIEDLCVETLGEVMSLLAREDVGPVEADGGDLAITLLPTVVKTTASMLGDNSCTDEGLVRRMVSVLLDMIRQMTEDQYKMVVRVLEIECYGGSRSLLPDALQLFLALLRKPVFKPHWADMLTAQLNVMLHALRLLSTTLRDRLQVVDQDPDTLSAVHAQCRVWFEALLSTTLRDRLQVVDQDPDTLSAVHAQCRVWFEACARTAVSPQLQLESLHAARRQGTVKLYGDMRRDVAHCMTDMWYSLGEHKRAFIPSLVGPFLEVSFLCDDEVRNTTIPVFFDMMQTEYTQSIANGEIGDSHLKDLESELIDKLDTLVELGYGDAGWRVRFVSICGALCGAAAGTLRSVAASLVAAAARQLDTLLQYQAAASKSSTSHRMHLTTKVLHFYEQIERPHMYIRYVHKLAKMYQASQLWVEAGLTLRLHSKLLLWTHEPLPPRLRHPTIQHDSYTTHRELKEWLYNEIAHFLNQGRQWELAVDLIKELVSVYEESALGYTRLADLHMQLSSLYSSMLRTPRSHPGYFRVIYHGKGFPELLRVPQGYIYRGNEYEQLQEFMERMLDEWPDAETLLKLDPPGEEITNSNGQYLQINAVEPIMSDKLKRLSGKPIAEKILQYYKHNNVDKFMFSRPVVRPEVNVDGSTDDISSKNEFATRWLQRTELEISDKLPGILRWFPVISQRTYWVSPVEAAVETLKNANRTLKSLIIETRATDTPLHPLTMKLNGMLDPAVQGGIENYEKCFLNKEYEQRHADHKDILAELKGLIADQIPLLKFGLQVHSERASEDLQDLHAHMVSCFRRVQHHVHMRYGKKTCDIEMESPEVQLRTTLRNNSHTDSIRISDVSTHTNDSVKSPTRFFPSRNSSGGNAVSFTIPTLQRRKQKQRNVRKSEMGTQSSGTQWYTPNGGTPLRHTINNNPSTPIIGALDTPTPPRIELRQERQRVPQLVAERPPRADVERRASQRASLLSSPPSNRDSMGTTDSNQDEEEPPPLPEKIKPRSMDLDETNNNSDLTPVRHNYDTVWQPKGSFLYNSMMKRDKNKAPTPPPKKRNAQ